MKSKKYLAIALSISILASSFSGVYISYAGNDISENPEKERISDSAYTLKAPDPYIIKWEPETDSEQNDTYISNIDINSDNENLINNEKSVFDSKESNVSINADISPDNQMSEDMYSIDKKDIEKLLQEGVSPQDIIDADNIANETGEDPLKILENNKDSDNSSQEIKIEIQQENKDKALSLLKDKYEKEYKKLIKANLSDDEILAFLGYIDINGLKMTDELIKEYRKLGEELFKKNIESTLSAENKKKYNISDKDEKILNDRLIQAFEEHSKEAKVSVKDMINNYIKDHNK